MPCCASSSSISKKSPFRDWLGSLDRPTQARVFRCELGNLGDHKSVGGGVWEARVSTGPGYRIYFGKERQTVILLLRSEPDPRPSPAPQPDP